MGNITVVDVSKSQLETVAMDAYQRAVNEFAEEFDIPKAQVKDFLMRNMEREICNVAELAFLRYSKKTTN